MLINDHFQNFKGYQIPRAQLVIADIPYNVGINAYGSNPSWYVGGDNKNGESELAGTSFFDTDENFRPSEFMHFCNRLMIKEPKQAGKAPCMIVFCSFEQQFKLIELAKQHNINHYINLVFRKNFSAQVLKANMRVVGNAEYGLLLYRDKLPKFNNNRKMIFNVMDWEDEKDYLYKKIHPTQKPVKLLEKLISIFTDEGDVVIDPVAGSGSTLVAADNLDRRGYGFEIKKDFYAAAAKWIDECKRIKDEIKADGYSRELIERQQKQASLFSVEATS
ncbi:MAG: site-specific DNA-methyltransferase [Chloroflexi bacterium]|jgi:site-specific DNA-methyltransferase (adenine-specific)|nr:site-specific DNA-methyltransferase [Chloroflexota bacterium]